MRSFQNKKGVSLIAVLLFMLVATIAATATFKWLSSSNSSSGSRMAQQEAYQSSLAGLENARTWMTYHANDVGSLIKQYKDANKGKSATDAPVMIKLNNQLKSLTRSGQEYDVWLAGVNTEESTYKLKILSTGKARNGSVYSQVGIFNVDGLYQVKRPQEKVSGEINFDYAYFGGGATADGRSTLSSGLINGDLSGSEYTVSNSLVVLGNVTNSGSDHLSLTGDNCISGNITTTNSGLVMTGSLYIGGYAKDLSLSTGGSQTISDLYVEGNLTFSGNSDITVTNMTVNGDVTGRRDHSFTVNGNMCLSPSSTLDINEGDNGVIKAYGNVWAPGTVVNKGFWNNATKVELGKSGYDVYINGATTSAPYKVNGMSFISQATVHSSATGEPPFTCADRIKNICLDKIANSMTTEACPNDSKKNKMKELLKVPINSIKAKKTSCSISSVTDLNNCFTSAEDNELYNGYLVFVGTAEKFNGIFTNNNSKKITSNVIFVITDNDDLGKLPFTDADHHVFLYLEEGAGTISVEHESSGPYNYYVFSKKDISELKSNNVVWSGGFYLLADNCASINTIGTGHKLNYNKAIVDALAANGVICDYNATSCGSGGTIEGGSGTETSEETLDFGSADSYYVANAPQLSVSLETQYKSNESAPTGADASTDLKEDFIVLPRVIYLTTNPYGKLEDYYSVIPLNGLKEENLNGSVGSCGSIPTSGDLYNRKSSSPSPLPSGITVCNYTASVNGQSQTVPFYIVVTGSSGNGPEVSFTESYKSMAKGGFYAVQVNVPAHDATFKLKVIKPSVSSEWTITPNGGTCADNECTFDISSEGVVTLFNVTSNTENGTATFQLQGGEGYSVGSPSSISLFVSSAVTIQRTDVEQATLSTYCTNNPGNCPSRDDWPNCSVADGVSWVRADNGVEGNNCTQATANQEWNCPTAATIKFTPITEGNDCIIIIPENEFIEQSTLTTGESYTLHASAKARPLTFTFGFAGRDYADESITASVEGKPEVTQTCYGRNGECTLEVFQGEQVNVTYGETKPENFNFWSCTGTDCPTDRPQTGKVYSVVVTNGTNKVLAHYNEKDEHCFFDEFKLSGTDCNESLDYCIGTNGKKWKVANSTDLTKINYQTGSISVKPNKMDKAGVTIMSTAVAGFEGTMKAQFQVPRVVRSAGTEIPETVKNSGIILHANETGSTHLLLNLYADEDGNLTARLCKQDGSGCITKLFDSPSGKLSISSSEAIVTLTITMTADGIELGAVSNASRFTSSSSDLRTAEYKYAIDGFSTYQSSGEYLGVRLADPEFKLFDIGWYSKDYEADCWDTPPTVICSFKAAYPSGIVPISSPEHLYAKPWVGLSSWYDAAGCEVSYLYKGTDACGGTTYDYTECGSEGYNFSEDGLHGIVKNGTDTSLAARAGVQNCNDLGNESYKKALEDQAFCGSFWVGKMEGCKTGIEYTYDGESDGAKIYKTANATENLRMTTLTIELQNSDNAEIEVYLISQDYDGTGEYTSKSFVTKANTVINVPVDSILDAAGFNPEKVTSVAIAIPGGASVAIQKVYTTCPNEVSLSCNKNLEYNAAAHHWKYSVRVNNYTELASLETWGFSGTGLSMEPIPETRDIADQKCEGNDGSSTQCDPTVDGKSATYSFYIDDYPYKDPKDYAFVVKLTDKDGVTYNDNSKYGCATNVITITGPSVECSVNAASKFVTEGLPDFNYSIDNCPACSYRISMFGTGEEIVLAEEANSPNPEGSISVSAENSNNHENSVEHPLAAGKDYKFRIVSTDANMPFDDCEGEFIIKEVTAASGECSIVDSYITGSITGADYGDATVSLVGTDLLGNILGIETIAAGNTHDINIDLNNMTLTGGATYAFTLRVNNDDYNCGSYTAPLRIELTCPGTINNQKADDAVNVTPIVSGCGGVCSWTLTGGSVNTSGTNYDGGQISFTDTDGNGTVSYTIQLSREGAESKSCSFDVNFKGRMITCSAPQKIEAGRGNRNIFISSTVHDQFDIYIDDSKVKDGEWFDVGDENKARGDFTASTTLGPHTYKVTKHGSTSAECSGTFEVINPLTCEIENEVRVGVQNTFKVSKDTAANSCWNCSYTNVNCGSNGCANGIQSYPFTINDANPKVLKVSCTCDNTSFSCSQTATAFVIAPTVTCPKTHYSANPNERITFTPDALGNCEVGCDYTIVKDGETDPNASKSDHSYKTASGIPFLGDDAADETKYIFTVTNTKGSASCDFYVDYKKPTIENCPTSAIDADPRSTITLPSTLTVGNCSSGNCKYSITGGGNTIAGPTTYSSSGTISFTGESAVGKKSYTLTISNGGPTPATCNFKVNYKAISVSGCSPASKSVEPGESFDVTPTVSHCGGNCWYSFDGGSTHHDYTGGDIPLSTDENGSTTNYTLTFGNNVSGNKGSCDVSVTYLKPEVTCPASTISVEPGGRASYDPGVSNCEQGCKYTISKAGSPLPESITEYTYTGGSISFVAGGSSTPDTYSLTVTNKAGQSATECKFDVNYLVPTFTCPTVSGSKTTGTDVTVTPTNVQNCTNGCTYSIEPVYNGSGTASGTYRSDRELGPVTENSAGTTTYALHLINAAGQDTRNCTFDVEYRAAACAEINWTISRDNGNLNSEPIENPECVTINTSKYCTGEVQIKVAGCKNKPGKWNGNSFTFDASDPAYKQYGSNPTPRLSNTLELPDRCGSSLTMYMTGCIDLNYASSAPVITCPTSTKTVAPGGSVSIPVSNCRVIGGCNYMITATGTTPKQGNGIIANSISFTGESATNTYNYTMNVSNSEGDATPCNFSVQYDANSAEPVGSGKYYGPKKIKISHTGTCQVNTSSNCSTWPNWVSNPPSCYGSNGQVSGGPTIDIPSGQWFEIQNCW